MVTLVWLILSWCGVCDFSWWPLFIEGIVGAFYFGGRDADGAGAGAGISLGMALFAAYKLFWGLSISAWWILASPIALALLSLVPGGFVWGLMLLDRFGLAEATTSAWITMSILSALLLIVLIVSIYEAVKDRKNR